MKRAEKVSEISKAFNLRPLKYDEMDELYCDSTMECRTGAKFESPIMDIFEACQMPSENNAFLLMGHRGCGKSTELNKMSADLIELGYYVSIINCLAELDIFNLTYSDLLILMCDALLSIANEVGCKLDPKLIDDLISYWKTEVETIEEINKSQGITVDTGLSVKTPTVMGLLQALLNVKADLRVNANRRTIYRTKISNSTNEWLGMLRQLTDAITEKTDGKRPVLIFEDLDKQYDLNKVFEMFNNHAVALTDVAFTVIYTCPIELSYYPRYASLKSLYITKTLPMIKIKNLDGGMCEEGVAVINKIIEKRANLSLFDKDVVNQLINKTGGSLRDLFTCINGAAKIAVRKGAKKIMDSDINIAFNELQSSLARMIDSSNYDFLADIAKGNRQYIENKQMLLEMLQANTVLEYNAVGWFNVHPLVRDFLVEIGKVPRGGS